MHDQAARKVAEQKWRSNLDDAERDIVTYAEKLDEVIPELGAPYRAPFFLHAYLRSLGVGSELVVGFVNNGKNNVYRSHAWVKYNDSITDVGISHIETSDEAGPLKICGFDLRPGKIDWTYHTARPSGSAIAVFDLIGKPSDRQTAEEAEELHMHMMTVARDLESVRDYLNQAPDKIGYNQLVEMMR